MKTNTTTSINTLKMHGMIPYDTVIEDAGRQIFQCEETEDSIYVLNTETKRATKYNAEGLNGKRISVDEFESKMADMILRVAKQQAEEAATTEQIEEIQKEMAPKAKKARRSKDIAYTYYTDDAHTNALLTLTAKQVDFIRHLPDTMFWERGLESEIWVDCLCDDIQGQFQNKPMTVGAMISTLCEKGLGTRATSRRDNRKCTSFALTELGMAVAIDLGLE